MKGKIWVFLLVGLIAVTVAQTWSPSAERPDVASIESSIELAGFNSVAKALFGVSQILTDQRAKLIELGFKEKEIEQISFAQILRKFLSTQNALPASNQTEPSQELLYARAIVLGHIGDKADERIIASSIKAESAQPTNFSGILKALYIERAPAPLSQADFDGLVPKELNRSAPWIVSLLKSDLISTGAIDCCPELDTKVKNEAKRAATIFIALITLVTLLGALGFISLLTFLLIAAFRDLHFRYEAPSRDTQPLLEQFVIYFFALNLVFLIIGSVAKPESTLEYNLIGILSLFTIALWPLLRGYKFAELRAVLGLKLRSFWQLIGDVISGPLTFVSAWGPFLIFSALYSLLLSALGTSPAQGSHPIIPILLDRDQASAITILTILAVLVVPIQEELMFRGALYSWLRSKHSAKLSIFLSGFIFAVVHPQGPIGVLPLTLIGMLLAFLREWRGTLLPCILLHMCINGGIFMVMWALRS